MKYILEDNRGSAPYPVKGLLALCKPGGRKRREGLCPLHPAKGASPFVNPSCGGVDLG